MEKELISILDDIVSAKNLIEALEGENDKEFSKFGIINIYNAKDCLILAENWLIISGVKLPSTLPTLIEDWGDKLKSRLRYLINLIDDVIVLIKERVSPSEYLVEKRIVFNIHQLYVKLIETNCWLGRELNNLN